MNKKYINKWVAVITKSGKIMESSDTFEKLYKKLDDKRGDISIRYITDPRFTISP